ncbi:MAG: hypothetical protein L0387_42360 [Acidobacteria bacterium]|nr:hypothetical protein [Acidobacteriota bacterium]
MQRLLIVIVALVFASLHAQQRHSSQREKLMETGGAFLKTCSVVVEKPTKALSSSELLDANYCAAYIAGFVDALQVTAELYQEPLVCPPDDDLDIREATMVVLAYIRERPERRERTTAVLVGAALSRAFPCRQER